MVIEMDDLILREARPNDRKSLDKLFLEELKYHRDLMPDAFKMPEIVVEENWLESVLNDNITFLVVAEDSKKIVGAILFKIVDQAGDIILKKRRYGYIEEMIVQESQRRKGIGEALLDHAVESLKAKQIKIIEINVWENNEIGMKFYEKYGFQGIRRRMKMEIGK
jgi:ribosomal protein S18 acetylase RimI-like enzyme